MSTTIRLVGVGGGFNIPELRQCLAQHMKMDVQPLRQFAVPAPPGTPLQTRPQLMATAMGMALQQIVPMPYRINLTPERELGMIARFWHQWSKARRHRIAKRKIATREQQQAEIAAAERSALLAARSQTAFALRSGGIKEVVIFVTDVGVAKSAKQFGSFVQRIPPRTMIPTTDAQLGLNGALIAHMTDRPFAFEDAPEMDSSEWEAFLNRRFVGQRWDRWFGNTPSAIYSVVVVRS